MVRISPRTGRDTLRTILDVTSALLLAAVAVAGVLIGEPLFVALAVAIGATAFARRCERRGVELTDRALDVAQVRRELAACEVELDAALGELARRDLGERTTDE